MSALLVVTSGNDPSSELLVEAAQSLGIGVSLADLRHRRFTVTVGAVPTVHWNGQEVEPPAVVLNMSSVNGLGLAGGDALLRQQSSRWKHRHFGAREEQGLLLAVFGLFRRQGSLLVNGPEACDLALMPNAVIERLRRRGIATNWAADGDHTTEILVAGGRGIIHMGAPPGSDAIETAIAVAAAAEFQLGTVRMVIKASGRPVVCGWTHRPDLSCWPMYTECATEILLSFPIQRSPADPNPTFPFFVEDIAKPSLDHLLQQQPGTEIKDP